MNRLETNPETSNELQLAVPRSVLRRTLPGEYLSLAVMLHAGFGSIVWASISLQTPSALLLVAIGIWIMGRVTGAFSHSAYTPFVTFGLLAVLSLWPQPLELPSSTLAVFSVPAFVGMLGLTLVLDLAELAMSPAPSAWLRSRNWYRVAAWTLGITFLVYMVVIPTAYWLIQLVNPSEPDQLSPGMSFGEQVRLRTMEAMAAFWFFALGATVGSFLNVVVYRMPRGESVVVRRSRCPRCEVQIEGRDNIPIYGWLLLNGRCRNCEELISPRYPTVELITAAIFLLLFFVELISGGANVPIRQPNFYHGVLWIIFYAKWDLITLYLFHCFALSALLTWTLIDIDRQRIPAWACWYVGTILCLIPLLFPDLLPVKWWSNAGFGTEVAEWLTGIVGAASGALLGGIVARARSSVIYGEGHHKSVSEGKVGKPLVSPDDHLVSAGMIAGFSVGWQAVFGVLLLTLVLRPFAVNLNRRWNLSDPPMTGILLIAFLLHLTAWRFLAVTWWPSYLTSSIGWVIASVGFALLWAVNRSIAVVCNARPAAEESLDDMDPQLLANPLVAGDDDETQLSTGKVSANL